MARAGSVRVNIDADASGMRRGVSDAERSLSRLNRAGGTVMRGLGKAALGLGVAAGTGLAASFAVGTREMMNWDKVAAITDATIKSTGGAAKVTAKELDAQTAALQNMSGVADDQIRTGQNMLLTFKNIRNEVGEGNDIYNQATEAALDMSVALGTDMKSSALQLGKALNDPDVGLSRLERSGVSFTKQQKEQVKALVESGKTLQAQKIILGEVNSQFGGTAKAVGDSLPGQIERAKRTFEDLSEEMVRKTLPALLSVVDTVRRHWPTIERVTRQAFEGAQRHAQRAMAWYRTNILPTIQAIVSGARAFWDRFGDDVTAVFNLVQRLVGNKLKSIGATIEGVMAVLRGDWKTAWESLKTVVSAQMDSVKAILSGLPSIMFGLAREIGAAITRGVLAGMGSLVSAVQSKIRSALGAADNTPSIRPENITGQSADSVNFMLRRVGAGTSTSLQRTEAAGSRAGDQARLGAENAARGAGKSAEEIRKAGDIAYNQARQATVRKLSNDIRRRRARLVTQLTKLRKQLMKTNVPKSPPERRRRALDRRASLSQAINNILDELETLAANYFDLQVEMQVLGADLAEINRAEEAVGGDDTAAASEAAPSGITPDAQAQIDQANNRATTAGRSAAISDSFLRTLFGSGSIDPSGGAVNVNINVEGSLVHQGQVAAFVAAAFGGQGSVPASSFASGA